MGHPRGFALPIAVIAVAAFVAACSSSQDKTPQGSLAVAFGASRVAASDDPMALLEAASITIADVEARKTDGSWVPIDSGLPAVIDVLALANGARSATLPPDLLPEGQYDALQLRINQIELTLTNSTRVTIAPPGAGWVILIPVDFGVVNDKATTVALTVRVDLSFKSVNGEFEFEPEIEVEGIKRD